MARDSDVVFSEYSLAQAEFSAALELVNEYNGLVFDQEQLLTEVQADLEVARGLLDVQRGVVNEIGDRYHALGDEYESLVMS